jgi:hypothetical protein
MTSNKAERVRVARSTSFGELVLAAVGVPGFLILGVQVAADPYYPTPGKWLMSCFLVVCSATSGLFGYIGLISLRESGAVSLLDEVLAGKEAHKVFKSVRSGVAGVVDTLLERIVIKTDSANHYVWLRTMQGEGVEELRQSVGYKARD